MNPTTSIRCRVCEKAYDGSQHCGVEVCRACAAFYKRALQLRKRYICKKGGQNCTMDNTRKECCQYCRFERCRLVGLVMNVDDWKSPDSPGSSSATTSGGETSLQINNYQYLTNRDTMPLLRRFCHYYNITIRNRLIFENGLRSVEETLPLVCKGKHISLLHHDAVAKIYRLNSMLRKELLNEAFPAFAAFTEEYQQSVFIQLMFHPWNLESAFRSLRLFDDPDCSILMWSETMYVHKDKMLEHIVGLRDVRSGHGVVKPEPKLLGYLREMVSAFLTSTHKYLHEIQISDVEFLAALALCFWDHSIYRNNSDATIIAEKQRTLIFDELHYYYRHALRIDNYVQRVMDLQGISKYIKENVSKLHHHMNFLKPYNYGTEDSVLFDDLSKLPRPYDLN